MNLVHLMDFKLVVLKERSIWVVDANPSVDVSSWTISLLSDRVGCVSHKSVQQVGADVYFLSREGIQSVSNIEAGSQAAVQVAVSAPIDDLSMTPLISSPFLITTS